MATKHILAAVMGLSLMIVLSIMSQLDMHGLYGASMTPVTDIGVEHSMPLSLYIETGMLHGEAVMEIHNESDETIGMSVPSSWVRREVFHASIETVTADTSTFGFTRWALPGGAGIGFRIQQAPQSVILHAPNPSPLKVRIAKVHLDTDTVEEDVVLIHGKEGKLW